MDESFAGGKILDHGRGARQGFTHVTLCRYEEPGVPFVKTLEKLGMEGTHIPNYLAQKYFLETVEELKQYDVAILSVIAGEALLLDPDMMFDGHIHSNWLQAIREYVRQGCPTGVFP